MTERLAPKVVVATRGGAGIGRAVAARAALVAFRFSDEAAFITDAALAIDGGSTAQ